MLNQALMGAVFGSGLAVPWLALSFLAWRLDVAPFLPFELTHWLIQVMPGGFITSAVEGMVGLLQGLRLGSTSLIGKTAEAWSAVLFLLVVLAVLGAMGALLAPRVPVPGLWLGLALGLALWLIFLPAALQADWAPATYAWALVLSVAWGGGLGLALGQWRHFAAAPADSARRQFLAQLGAGVLAVSAVGFGISLFVDRRHRAAGSVGNAGAGAAPPVPDRPAAFDRAAGARPEQVPVSEFYRVDIRLDPPKVDPDTWHLEVGGLVDQPLRLTYAELAAMPVESFYATLECISNRVGGDLISTTWFTGVPLRAVLERAGVQSSAVDIKFTSVDGYTESLPLRSALDPETRLCLGMGGQPLTAEHGFPLRLYTPNRFGMKNPKWIMRIEAINSDYHGYWEQRNWDEQAWVQITSAIDAAQASGGGGLRAAGIAYAGSQGIQSVEIRVDDGGWMPAEIYPALSPLTWVIWRASLQAAPGDHQLTVRATNGTGTLQTAVESPPTPVGATGYHSRRLRVT